MGLLDEVEKNREHIKHVNPLANDEITKKKLPVKTLRIDGDLHSKILALKTTFGDKNNLEFISNIIGKVINELDDENRVVYEKYYHQNLEEKIDVLRKQGRL